MTLCAKDSPVPASFPPSLLHHRAWKEGWGERGYRVTSVIRNKAPLGPYSREMPRAPRQPEGGGLFLMSEVPLHRNAKVPVCEVPL